MTPLYNIEQFNNCKSREKLPLQCEQCKCTFYKAKNQIQGAISINTKRTKYNFCSHKCHGQYITNTGTTSVICKTCKIKFNKRNYEIEKSDSNFCSRSCAATQNNTHKTTGTRRSKLEKWLEQQLTNLYPNLEIHFNKKDIIGSELDIYIPSIKLAFELNGIFHYEPIFGLTKLNQIQNNDQNKFQLCQQHNINLCIIDTSSQKYVKEQTSKKFLNIITTIINQHLAE